MRSSEIVTTLKAPPETVWKAITDPEEITRWLAPQASVEPQVGGKYSISWGPGTEGTMLIEIWEPNRRLRLIDDRRVAVEYFIETEGGVTTLRLVHSGFGDGAEWDGEYEGAKKGWLVFFLILKHNLEQHPGEAIRQISVSLPVDASPDEQWDRLLGRQLGHLESGSHYSLQMPGGDRLEGSVTFTDNRAYFVGVVENWNRALMTVFCERFQGKGFLTVNVALYGTMVAQADEIETRWTTALKELFCFQSL